MDKPKVCRDMNSPIQYLVIHINANAAVYYDPKTKGWSPTSVESYDRPIPLDTLSDEEQVVVYEWFLQR